MAKGKIGGFLVHLVILAVLFLSMTQIVFSFHSKMLIGEFLLLLFFIFIAFIAMAGKLVGGNWGNAGLTIVYGLNMVNLLFIYYLDKRLAAGTMVVAVLGFVFAMISFRRCKSCNDDFDDDFEEIEPVKSEVTTSFEPGKYVASKTGKKFHAPRCDWAKRIKKASQVWFNDKDEAKKRLGF